MLEKHTQYREISLKQPDDIILAEDTNQLMTNISMLKGGEDNEPPLSNIKELKERIDNLSKGSIENIQASEVAFDNTKSNLNFTIGYDFPPIKNALKDNYTFELVDINNLETQFNDANAQIIHITKENGKYYLKGNLILKDSQNLFTPRSVDNETDLGKVFCILQQFINKEYSTTDFTIETTLYYIPLLKINCSGELNKEYNINIELDDIKNIDENFICFYDYNNKQEVFTLINNNQKVFLKGSLNNNNNNTDCLILNPNIENYFEVFEDDSNYIKDEETGLLYYFKKEVQDYTDVNQNYANVFATYYSLILKENTTNIQLEATKNNILNKIEKEKNIQNAIDILASHYELNKLKKTSNIIIEDTKLAIYDLYTYNRAYMIGNLLFTVFFPSEIGVLSLINLNNTYINNEYQSMIYDFNALGFKSIKMNYPTSNKVHAFCIELLAGNEEEQNAINDLKEQFNNNSFLLFNKITFIAKDGFDNFDIMTEDVREHIKLIEEQI